MWAPGGLEGQDPSGLSYVVVDEIEGGTVGLAVSEWPRVDGAGRVRFATPPVLLGADRTSLERFLGEHRRPTELAARPLRIGDVFALRARPEQLAQAEEAEARLEPVLAPEEWIEPPVYDVTPDARDAAKASFYAAVTPSLGPSQVARLDEIIEHPAPPPRPPPPPSTSPSVRPPRGPGFRLLQILAGGALFAGGIGAGVGASTAGVGPEHTTTKPGRTSTVPTIVNHTFTETVVHVISNGSTTTTTVPVKPTKVTVPNVVGKSQSEATSVLGDAKLTPAVRQVPSDEPEGTVTAQVPPAGREVEESSKVRLSVSNGPDDTGGAGGVEVPSVIGEPFKVALRDLKAAGFVGTRADEEVPSEQPKGTVVAQSLEGGTLQPVGSTVTLSLSAGPATPTTVPDVTGLPEETAINRLEGQGFDVSKQGEATTDQSKGNVVLEQDPVGGTEVEPDSTVTIVVGIFGGPVAA